MRFLRSSLSTGLTDARQRGRRWRRWVPGSVACLFLLLALVAGAVLVLLRSLDQPWLKHRLQQVARHSAGVELDYHAARIGLLSGAEIEGLVVQSPKDRRSFAPVLVRVGRLNVRWSLGSLRRGPVVERIDASDITVTVVVDEHGTTSFDALSPPSPRSPSSPPVPLSSLASTYLATALPVGQVNLERVTLAVVRTAQGAVLDRTELRGVSLTLVASSAEPKAKGWRVQAKLGSPSSPLDVGLTRTREPDPVDTARAMVWASAEATSLAIESSIDLRMMDQTLAPSVSADHWLKAKVSLRFDKAAKQTEVRLDHVEAGDDAVTGEASIEVSDGGEVMVRRARGDIDLARLLRWFSVGLVPATAERARVRYEVFSLAAGPAVHLSDGGSIAVDADLSKVLVSAPAGPLLDVAEGHLSLRAQPDGGGLACRGWVKLTRVGAGPAGLTADDFAIDLDGRREADGAVAGRLEVRFARLARGGAPSVVARGGHVELRAKGLHPQFDAPLATRGDIALSLEIASLDIRSSETHAIVDGLSLRGHTALEGHDPYSVELEGPAFRVRAIARDGSTLADLPGRVEGWARDVHRDVENQAATRAIIHAAVDLGETRALLDATRGADAIDFALRVTAPSLKVVRPFLPPSLVRKVPWDRMSVAVRSRGRLEHLAAADPEIRQTTDVDVDGPWFDNVGARSIALTVTSQGTALRHHADVDLHARGLSIDGGSPSDDHVTLSVAADREPPSLRFKLATEGRAATNVAGSLSFDRSRRAVPYAIEAHLAGLSPLAPLFGKVHGLEGFDLSQLDIGLSTRGDLVGVVSAISRNGGITFEPHPARTAGVDGTTDLRVAHFRWTQGEAAIAAPIVAWHGEMRSSGARRTVDSRADVGALHLAFGSHDIDVNGIHDETRAVVTGDLTGPELQVAQRLTVRAVEQTVVPEYPLGNLDVGLTAERSPDGVVHVAALRVANGVGGTALAVTGNVDLSEGRRALSLTGALTQDLARLSTIPERFKARGRLAVDANITSPDLAHYRVRAVAKGEDVTVALSRAGVDVESANGEVPIAVTFDVGDKGVAFERGEKRSPYSMLRFADQHPLLSRSGFLSIARLKTPFISIAPLVGNLEIEQNVVSLRQFEMGVRGGTITGQGGIDWNGFSSTLELHVRASGVQSSHGEPFDGNIAVVISLADRTVDGRAEILRIGERHLLDLLDLEDPLHVDPAMNRVRTALSIGYPESLRVVFDHGFASAHLELGGFARLVSIGELRGIPMGPIVDRMVGPMLDGPHTKETP